MYKHNFSFLHAEIELSLFNPSIFLDIETKPLFVCNIRKSYDNWKQNKAQRHDVCPNILHNFHL